jgi:hypothetical protein
MRRFFIKGSKYDIVCLRVARLGLWLDAHCTGLHLITPPAHVKFLQTEAEIESPFSVKGNLVLRFLNETMPVASMGETPLIRSENWELWVDKVGSYVFVALRQSPPLRVVVEPDFTTGEVLGNFSLRGEGNSYPIQNLEIKLFANWLASYGDIILHASGVVVDQKGYAFLGPAGAGKSTLAASLSADPAIHVLGEDQVILRYLDERFWIYGTPWHLNPSMCSPEGALLEKLFFLDKDSVPGVRPLTPADGVTRLLQTAFIPYYRPNLVPDILDRLTLLARLVPFHSLSYQLGSDAMMLIHAA